MIEIERKFLVNSNQFMKEATRSYLISQGFLNTHPDRTVRVRIRDNQGWLTVKGRSDERGITRFEWEKEIPVGEALELMNLCEEGIIQKRRFEVLVGVHFFEVDVFSGLNEGLILAEIELTATDEPFEKPDWLGKEVTGDLRYYNSRLSQNPYKNWK